MKACQFYVQDTLLTVDHKCLHSLFEGKTNTNFGMFYNYTNLGES